MPNQTSDYSKLVLLSEDPWKVQQLLPPRVMHVQYNLINVKSFASSRVPCRQRFAHVLPKLGLRDLITGNDFDRPLSHLLHDQKESRQTLYIIQASLPWFLELLIQELW
jgi:hypothetical protein